MPIDANAKASTVLVLPKVSWNMPVSTPEGLRWITRKNDSNLLNSYEMICIWGTDSSSPTISKLSKIKSQIAFPI